ncbi:MAG TPA: hypothetical protein GX505_00290 [Clostridiales bacterium]|nr:hypothetical protein [Clostridiales bacterium]
MRKKVGILTLGITLILCGAAIILARYTDWQFSDIYLLWPAFLILLGLEFIFTKLWYDFRKHEVYLSPSGISIFLAVVIILISSAWANQGLFHSNWNWKFNFSNFWPESYNETIEETYSLKREELPNVEKIVIDNINGSVEVLPSDDGRFELKAQIKIATNDKESASKLIDKVITVDEGREMNIKSNHPTSNRIHSLQHVNMKLLVPKEIEVQITTGFGHVLIRDMENNVTIRQKHSDVDISNIKGNVKVDCSFGDIYARKIDGDANINNAHGQVRIEDITGSAQVENSFNTTEARQIGKDLNVQSKHGQVKAEYITGRVIIKNEFAEVSCSNIEGNLEVLAEHSKVILNDIWGDINVETSYNVIHLTNPSFADANIDASTTFGSIKSDDSIGLIVKKESNLEEASTVNGNGNQKIRLKNQHGEIRINMN